LEINQAISPKNHKSLSSKVIFLLVNCWIYHAWKYYGYIIYTLLYLDGFMPQKKQDSWRSPPRTTKKPVKQDMGVMGTLLSAVGLLIACFHFEKASIL